MTTDGVKMHITKHTGYNLIHLIIRRFTHSVFNSKIMLYFQYGVNYIFVSEYQEYYV